MRWVSEWREIRQQVGIGLRKRLLMITRETVYFDPLLLTFKGKKTASNHTNNNRLYIHLFRFAPTTHKHKPFEHHPRPFPPADEIRFSLGKGADNF
jgi:hypothetical protein